MAPNTKEKILEAALERFSENGYDGTSLQEIADDVGIVKSALFRHFGGKEEIWNALLDRMDQFYEQRFGSEAHLPGIPASGEELVGMTMHMLDLTVHEASIRKVRRLLLIEQFRNDRARELATLHFLTGLESMFARLFEGMMDNGSLRREDPVMLAFQYTAPITVLVHLCEREPDREAEAMSKARAFAEHFVRMYAER